MRILQRSTLLLDAAATLYNVVNHDPLLSELPPMPRCLYPSVDLVYKGAGRMLPTFLVSTTEHVPRPVRLHDDLFVLGMTGGKDSLAVAIKLIKEGMRGVGVHVRGINPAYPHEASAAQEQARALKMKYREVRVRVNKEYIENPARNHTILLILAEYARILGAGTVVEGLHEARVAATQPFKTGWSDCKEMARAGQEMLSDCVPWLNNRLVDLPMSDTESIEYVHTNAPRMIPMVRSCMTTARHYARVRAISQCIHEPHLMLPGRCGACYKCCREWLVLREIGSECAPPNDAYRKYAEDGLVRSAPFCFGPVAATWSREKIISEFLCRPSRS